MAFVDLVNAIAACRHDCACCRRGLVAELWLCCSLLICCGPCLYVMATRTCRLLAIAAAAAAGTARPSPLRESIRCACFCWCRDVCAPLLLLLTSVTTSQKSYASPNQNRDVLTDPKERRHSTWVWGHRRHNFMRSDDIVSYRELPDSQNYQCR